MNKTPSSVPPVPAPDFWKPSTLEDLAAEQGVAPIQDGVQLCGQDDDLWVDDAEFEQFLNWLHQSRRAGA